MTFTITGKHMNVGGALTSHAEETIRGLVQKYYEAPTEISVVINKRGHLYFTEVSVHLKYGVVLRSHAEADELYPSFDAAASKIGTLLSKNKDREAGSRKENRKAKESFAAEISKISVGSVEDCFKGEKFPLIIAELSDNLPTLTTVQAVEYMEDLKTNILVFRNIKHNSVNVVYIRDDGNIGWIDPDRM